MSDCNAANIVDCVGKRPSLAFAATSNVAVFFAGAWIWFLSLQGIFRWTDSEGLYDFLVNVFKGMASLLSGLYSSNAPSELLASQADNLMAGWSSKIVYIISLGVTVSVGYSYREDPVFGSLVVGALFFASWLLNFGALEFPLTVPVVGGVFLGVFVTLILWFINFFSASEENGWGDSVMILLTIWIAITLFAWYGSRLEQGKSRPRASKKGTGYLASRDRALAALNDVEVQRAEKNDKYPTSDWVNNFVDRYTTVAEAANINPSPNERKNAFLRALPALQAKYDRSGVITDAEWDIIVTENFP